MSATPPALPKTGLLLTGGGARAAYQVGVLEAIADIRNLLGDRLSTAQIVREQHGKDQTWNPSAPPDAVAFS